MTENILIISEDGKTVVKCTDKNIENVVIPEGIECIGESAFQKCIRLKNIQFPSSLFSIHNLAFYRCKNLEKVDLSETNLIDIRRCAFYKCSNLSNIDLPPKEILIGRHAFDGCPIMNYEHKSLKIKNGLVLKGKSIVGYTIEQSTLDLQIPKGVEVIESHGISFDELHVLKIGNGITKIQADAILSYNLCLLWLPPTLKKISTEAFGGECNPAVIVNETKINMNFPGTTIVQKKSKYRLLLAG